MKKALSRFLFLILIVLIALLTAAGTMYILKHHFDMPEVKDSAIGVEIFPTREDTSADYSRIESKSLSRYDDENETFSTRGYDALMNENEKYLYERLADSVYRIGDEVDDNGRYKTELVEISGAELEPKEINTTINAFLYDNPQVFWLDNYFGYQLKDGKTYVECYSMLSGNQCEIYIKRLNEAIEEMLTVISSEDGKYEREMKLHDKLLEKCSYNREVQSLEDGWKYFSAYGAIVEGSAVCEGYSKAMMILLNLAGVETTTVRGVGEGERHMWNLVEIGGNWYHLDATWDDDDSEYVHDFFNMTDELIESDHTSDPLLSEETYTDDFSYNFFLPQCSSLDMNFFNVEGMIVTSLGDDTDSKVAGLIYDKASRSEDKVCFMVTGELSYDEFISYLLDNNGEKFLSLAERANEHLDEGHRLRTNSCNTLKNPERKTLRVRVYFEA